MDDENGEQLCFFMGHKFEDFKVSIFSRVTGWFMSYRRASLSCLVFFAE